MSPTPNEIIISPVTDHSRKMSAMDRTADRLRQGAADALMLLCARHGRTTAGHRKRRRIILPSYTFVSTANAFVLRGAIPVFVDIREDTLNLDEQLIEDAITPRTRSDRACALCWRVARLSKLLSFLLPPAAPDVGRPRPAGKAPHAGRWRRGWSSSCPPRRQSTNLPLEIMGADAARFSVSDGRDSSGGRFYNYCPATAEEKDREDSITRECRALTKRHRQ